MAVHTYRFDFETQGRGHTLDLTGQVANSIVETGLAAGIVTLFVPGSTGAVTTIEYEPGALEDFYRFFEEVIPEDRTYQHNLRWGDGNGHSHVRAALLGPSITIPFAAGKLLLGQWQQIIFVDFDVLPRSRTVIAQVMGERGSSNEG